MVLLAVLLSRTGFGPEGIEVGHGDQRPARPVADEPFEHPLRQIELGVALPGLLQAARLGGIVLREQDAGFEVMARDLIGIELLDQSQHASEPGCVLRHLVRECADGSERTFRAELPLHMVHEGDQSLPGPARKPERARRQLVPLVALERQGVLEDLQDARAVSSDGTIALRPGVSPEPWSPRWSPARSRGPAIPVPDH